MTILDTLAEAARARVRSDERTISRQEMRRMAEECRHEGYTFEAALRRPGLSFICECKKASPSKGVISPEFPYMEIARDYEAGGADAISVLTEPTAFLGQDRYLREIASAVSVPVLRKDFIVDEYMIAQAAVLGASAVLLIVSLLDKSQLRDSLDYAHALGLSALVEIHDEREAETAASVGARIVGVNNRNLRDFSVDPGNSARLRSLVPADTLFVYESGVQSAEDVRAAGQIGADAVLIGEALMRAPDRQRMLREFKRAVQ